MKAYILCKKRQMTYRTSEGFKSIRPSYGAYKDPSNWTKSGDACGFFPIRPVEFFSRSAEAAPVRAEAHPPSTLPSPSLSDQAMLASGNAQQARQQARKHLVEYLAHSQLLSPEKRTIMQIVTGLGAVPQPEPDLFLPLPEEPFDRFVRRGLEHQPLALARTLEVLPLLGSLLSWGMQ